MKHFFPTIVLLCFLSGNGFAQEDAPATDPTQARELIRQWVKTERLVSEEKAAWAVEKKRMQALLDLYQKELTLLNEELEKGGGATKLIDQKKEKLEADLKRYRASQRLLADTMARLLPRVRILVSKFPEPLREELSSDIEALNAENVLSEPRDVLRSTLSVVITAGRFNRSVMLKEEVRETSDGQKVSVDVLYLGLARAYYAARSGDAAGIGVPGENGWTWQADNSIANDVRRAVAVYRKDKQPQLIKLPIAIGKEASK